MRKCNKIKKRLSQGIAVLIFFNSVYAESHQFGVSCPRIVSGTFLTAYGGNAWINWQDFDASLFVSYTAHANSGGAYGFGIGYRFYTFFALEGGFVKLPTVKGLGYENASLPPTVQSVGVLSWYGYLIGKFLIELKPLAYFYLTLAAGITYRQSEPKPSQLFTNQAAYYYAPIFSAGLEYDFVQDWMLFMTYYYIPTFDRELPAQPVKHLNVPEVNLVTVGIGYKFSV